MPVLHARANGRKPGPQTGEQVLVTTGVDGQLGKSLPQAWNKRVRKMREHPTVGFVRDIYMAPILAAEWTVVSDGAEFKAAEQLIYDQAMKTRRRVLRDILRGLLDFGWQGFEAVWGYDQKSGKIKLRKLKPLLQDITTILVDPHGDLIGLRNEPTWLTRMELMAGRYGLYQDLWREEKVVFSRDVEGTNWYGQPLMLRVASPHDAWLECDKAARRYDTKIAGALWAIHYPLGSSKYGPSGEETDNYTIAAEMLDSIKASGGIVVPNSIQTWIDEHSGNSEDKTAWKIELISASGSSESTFVGRQKYLDALMARGIGIPERAVFEGQFGTKAEAEEHADFAIDNIEMGHRDIVDAYNEQVTDFSLLVNYGESFVGHVRVQASPLSDSRRALLRSLYTTYLGSSDGGADAADRVDWKAIEDELGVPTKTM